MHKCQNFLTDFQTFVQKPTRESQIPLTPYAPPCLLRSSDKCLLAQSQTCTSISKRASIDQVGLQQIFTSKILSKIMYASPAWVGLAGQEERTRINSFLRRSKRFGYYRLRTVKCLRSSARMPTINCLKILNPITIMFFITYYLEKIFLNITFVIGCIIIPYRLKMTEIL